MWFETKSAECTNDILFERVESREEKNTRKRKINRKINALQTNWNVINTFTSNYIENALN